MASFTGRQRMESRNINGVKSLPSNTHFSRSDITRELGLCSDFDWTPLRTSSLKFQRSQGRGRRMESLKKTGATSSPTSQTIKLVSVSHDRHWPQLKSLKKNDGHIKKKG